VAGAENEQRRRGDLSLVFAAERLPRVLDVWKARSAAWFW
jgi:hypothetical protein